MSDLIKRLSVYTGLMEYTVRDIISTAPERYKEYRIPKKNGGSRKIAQPAKELKAIQRAFVEIVLKELPIHSAAMAYREGLSIRDNAVLHSGNGPILKMDFKDFFPSITERDWVAYCEKTGCLREPGDIKMTSLLLFHRPTGGRLLRLAIGAPSSPILSNIIMHDFDAAISLAVAKDRVTYSRYADDLTFSASRTGYLTSVEKHVRDTIKNIDYPKLRVNEEKTTRVTRKYHRQVTGLTLSNDGRVTVGRDNKRIMRAALHHYFKNNLNADETARLAGMVAFVKAAEPNFFSLIVAKHGIESIQYLLSKSNEKHKSK